jgi:hypothetical protein
MMKQVLPYGFGLGLRNRQLFVAVSCAAGDVIWMKKPKTKLSKLPKTTFKREQLVGVIPEAAQVSTGADRAFILALERTQLLLVADDVATKQAWLAACFAVIERKANAISHVADVAMTASVTVARAEAEAAKLKAAAELKAEMERGRAQLHMQITAHGGAGLQLKEARTCVVCFEECHGYDGGIECRGSKPHFMCNECVVASVQSSITDELGKQDLRGGRLACPFRTFPHTDGSCDAPCYDDRVVATKVDAAIFEAYLQVRARLAEAKIARESNAEMERQVAAAIKRMDAQGPKVLQTQKHICDEILTMRCPRCKMAFLDWDGCNALYCTYAGCGCNFCAFCLKDCGGGVKFGQKDIERRGYDEVHKHINECKYAKGIGHGNDGRVQSEVWNQIRKERIEDCLQTMCETVEQRQKVVANLKKQLDDLGISVAVPDGAQTSPSNSAASSAAKPPPAPTLQPAPAPANGLDELVLPENIKPCPACGILIEKIDGNEEVMCGCEAKPAGGTYEKALRGGGCGHMFNFVTLAPMGVGTPGQPANERQVRFAR